MPTTNRGHFFRLGEGLPSPLAANIATQPRRHDNDYPLWQGPCGKGPLGGITQSMLVRFLSCRERFRLRYVLGLEPPDRWSHHLGYGNMWHVCEQVHAAGIGDPIAHLEQYAWQQQTNYPLQRDEIGKWGKVCAVQFPEYVRYWAEHPDVVNRTPLLQEQVFDVPYALPSGRVVRLRGKFDSVDLIGDGVYLQENKTKGDVDRVQVERQLKFDLQTMMYTVALTRVGDNREFMPELPVSLGGWKEGDLPIQGVRYNVVRRPLSGGRGNISPHKAKATKTKVTPAETEEQFYERLRRDYIAKEPDYWFFRVRAEISERDVRVFRDTCLDPLLETVCYWYYCVTNQPRELCFQEERAHPGRPGGRRQLNLNWPFNHYRTPFGVYSALEEGGATEYDHYLETGSEATLRRTENLFMELQ